MIREYGAKDFAACVELVNKIWNFDNRFKPRELSELFKRFYTAGSLAESNFFIVIEEGKTVKGFLFGKCGNKNLYKNEYSGLLGHFNALYQILFVKGVNFKKKINYLKNIVEHESNRKKVNPKKDNEVNLFVVDPTSQGKGYGKQLINQYIEYSKKQNAKRITLETDKECNYGFYDHLGFSVKGEFYSPLQKEYSGKSGDSYVYELKL